MKKILTLFSLMVCFSGLIAQPVIDIDADFISYDSQGNLNFIKKIRDGKYMISQIDVKKVENREYYLATNSRLLNDFKKDSSLIEVRSLANTKPKDFVDHYFKELYFNTNKATEKTSESIEVLDFPNNGLFPLYTIIKENSDWELKETSFYNYFFVQINQKKTLIIFINNGNFYYKGYFIVTKKGIISHINKNYGKFQGFSRLDPGPYKKIYENTSEERKRDFWILVNYSIEDGMVKDLISKENLLSKKYDSIVPYRNFIIGFDSEATDIFNKKLTNISPQNLRALHLPSGSPNYAGIQVLIDNKIRWLVDSGELKTELMPIVRTICGNEYDHQIFLNLKLTHDNRYFYINSHRLAASSTYDSIAFMNGNSNYNGYSSHFNNKLKVQINEKWGIIQLVRVPDKPTDLFRTKMILPVEYDFLEEVAGFTRIKKDNLWGFLELNENPKYRTLEKFQGYFSRFSLITAEKGWLTRDGKEYLDE